MQKRKLGKTGEEVSILGIGGFHLVEISTQDVVNILNRYLDEGGNYIETAPMYGKGESEIKVGKAIKNRREECLLTSKCHLREKERAKELLDESLTLLQTDHLDFWFMHVVNTDEDWANVSSPQGILRTAEEARKEGKIKYIGISGHRPEVLVKAVKQYPFDAVMAVINYYDRFNFPLIEDELIPLAQNRGTGIVVMKALADGFLWRSVENAFRYALSLPVSMVVAGINTMEMLEKDLKIVNSFVPMSEEEKEILFRDASELGNYVCRLCGKCLPCPQGIDILKIFNLEGYYDRQMFSGKIESAPDYALRERFRFWLGNEDLARERYEKLKVKATACTKCGECEPRCPYHIPIMRKLKIADYKLGGDTKIL
jgi:predicted aldo/keto reductase-like oxidoreductase